MPNARILHRSFIWKKTGRNHCLRNYGLKWDDRFKSEKKIPILHIDCEIETVVSFAIGRLGAKSSKVSKSHILTEVDVKICQIRQSIWKTPVQRTTIFNYFAKKYVKIVLK